MSYRYKTDKPTITFDGEIIQVGKTRSTKTGRRLQQAIMRLEDGGNEVVFTCWQDWTDSLRPGDDVRVHLSLTVQPTLHDQSRFIQYLNAEHIDLLLSGDADGDE